MEILENPGCAPRLVEWASFMGSLDQTNAQTELDLDLESLKASPDNPPPVLNL